MNQIDTWATAPLPSPVQPARHARLPADPVAWLWRGALFVAWAGTVLFVASHHTFWRDEVRALSIALQGSSVFDMLGYVHGEGHPALWYVLLRLGHAVSGSVAVLPVMAFAVAAASAALLVFRSPFPWWLLVLALFSKFSVFEYAVMARNYGISMLLMFLLAANYRRWRQRGGVVGTVLFLLANTNVHSVFLVGGFVLFWFFDTVAIHGLRDIGPGRALRSFIVGSSMAALGVVACVLTVHPSFNDAAATSGGHAPSVAAVASAIIDPAATFGEVGRLPMAAQKGLAHLPAFMAPAIGSIIMFASLLGLLRSPRALWASLLVLEALSLFFAIIYPGGYRHEALWLVFLVSMYWIDLDAATPGSPEPPGGPAMLGRVGGVALALLLALQWPQSIAAVREARTAQSPYSQAAGFAAFVAADPRLKNAVIMADPDYLVEPVTYYIGNPTYLPREERYGRYVKFTRQARQTLSLDDLLAAGRRVQSQSGRPVLVLLHESLDAPGRPPMRNEAYSWQLQDTPEQTARFIAATQQVGRFRPAQTDESFDAYLLNPNPNPPIVSQGVSPP